MISHNKNTMPRLWLLFFVLISTDALLLPRTSTIRTSSRRLAMAKPMGDVLPKNWNSLVATVTSTLPAVTNAVQTMAYHPTIFLRWIYPQFLASRVYIGTAFALTLFVGLLGKRMTMKKHRQYDSEIFTTKDGYPYGETDTYDPVLAAVYFSRRPWKVFTRSMQIFTATLAFASRLLKDRLMGRLTDPIQEKKRAEQLADTFARIGPSFIKVGQSLSIRSDLLRPAYVAGFTKLQDKVPPFPTALARQIIRDELGRPVEEVFSSGIEPTATVVAAASLGQVYKAVLRADGTEVAVKVQRPNMLVNVALDMYIMRRVAVPVKKFFRLNTDVLGLVDEW